MFSLAPQLSEALRQGLTASLLIGLSLSAVWGLWLLLVPQSALKFAAAADRWVATDPLIEKLNQPVNLGRLFYRYHRWAGLLITAGSGYCLARWAWAYDRAALIGSLDPKILSAGMDWLVPAIEHIFVVFNLVIALVGLVVFLRPSLLKAPERWANLWVRVPADRTLDRRYDPLVRALADRPRLIGGLIVTICVSLLAQLLPYWP